MNPPTSLYIHVPFCRHRCGYCNFALVAGRDHLIDSFLDALEIEMSLLPSGRLQTVFLGGGTPTHLDLPHLDRLFRLIETRFEIDPDAEFSVEGNPADFNPELVGFLADQRVNRISLGVQSFDSSKLQFLERDHDRETVFQAVEMIQRQFDNFSLDLIFGARGESWEIWRDDLASVVACGAPHVSTYSLTIEKGTQFWNRQNRNQTLLVKEDQAVDFYEAGIEHLQSAGLKHYEISNLARPGFECRHNINYWTGGEFFGLGPGAARYVNFTRATNHSSLTRYIQLLRTRRDATVESELLDAEQQAREKLIFGLRQIDGVDLTEVTAATGFEIERHLAAQLDRLVDQGWLDRAGQRLKLTRRGLLVSDAIWPDLL